MAVPYLNNIDLNKNELQNARAHNLSSAPSTPGLGQYYFHTTDKCLYVCTVAGTTWVKVPMSSDDIIAAINAAATSKINTANLTTGTGATDVALGNHSHAAPVPAAHNLVDTTNHPVTGLTAGHILKALTATTYGFAAHGLTAGDVGASASGHSHTHDALTGQDTGTYRHLTSTQVTDLTDTGDCTLHYHATDRAMANATGQLAVANGGTGTTTAQLAINALAGAVTAGYFLRGNATNVVMAAIQAGDVPTLNQSTSGTAANVTGTVAIANGGTGQITAQLAINALAGAVTSGSVLRGNGTNILLAAIQASDVPTLNQNTTGTAASCTGNAANVTGVVVVANGGSGLATVAANSYLKGNGTGNLVPRTYAEVLSDIGASGTGHGHTHDALTGQDTGTYRHLSSTQVTDLTDAGESTLHYHAADRDMANASGHLHVANGGTGLTTIAANSYLKGNGTSDMVPRTYAEVLSDIGAAASGHNHSGTYATVIHNLIDTTNHPVTGLTAGHYLKALSATTYGFAAIANTEVSGLGTASTKNTGTASGDIPLLTTGGLLPASMMPPIAIGEPFIVATEAAMLLLTAQRGDVALRSDNGLAYMLSTESPSTIGDWKQMTAAAAVASVAGKTGIVTLAKGDVGLGNVDNESKATILANSTLTGTVTIPIVADGETTASTKAAACGYVETAIADRMRRYATDFGDAAALFYVITHNLNTKDCSVTIRDNNSPYAVHVSDIEFTSVNTITIRVTEAPAAARYRVIVIG